ncbi:MAG: PilZ domain-containing protein [Myxococcota bacterium]
MTDRTSVPRVFIQEDTPFGDSTLSKIVAQAGCETILDPGAEDLHRALDAASPPLDLLVLVLHSSSGLKPIATLRKMGWLSTIPILIVSELDVTELDLWQLRALGVVGLINRGAPAEHVHFRVSQIAYCGRDGRRFERAPCCIPVEVRAGGKTSTDYAVSISAGGLGLAVSRHIEPNTVVNLRFSLAEGEEPIEASGRVVHIRERRREGANYEAGIFFHRLDEALHKQLRVAVHRLLAAWDAIGSSDITRG